MCNFAKKTAELMLNEFPDKESFPTIDDGQRGVVSSETKKSIDLFDEYRSSRRTWEDQMQSDLDFALGAQWTDEQIKALEERGQAAIVVNVIYPAVEQAKALLTANSPQFSATAREDSDIKIAAIMAELMSYIWQQSNGDALLKETIEDAYIRSVGYMLAYYDPYCDFGRGEVKLRSLDPMEVYVDPHSKDRFFADASNILISGIFKKSQILSLYPDKAQLLENAKEEGEDSYYSGNYVGNEGQVESINSSLKERSYRIIDRYSKIDVQRYHIYDPKSPFEALLEDEEKLQEFLQRPIIRETNSSGTRFIFDDKEAADYFEVLRSMGNVFHYVADAMGTPMPAPGPETQSQGEAIPNSTVELEELPMAVALEEQALVINSVPVKRIRRHISVGEVEFFNITLPVSDYPIVPFMFNHKRTPYPMSDVRYVRGLQEYINKIRSLIIAHAANSTNMKVFVPRGAVARDVLEEQWSRAGAAVIEYDGEMGAPVIASPPPLPNELYNNEAQARMDIQEILGIYNLSQGDPGQAQQTFKGTVATDEFGQRRIKSRKDDVEHSLNKLALVVVDMIQHYYTERKTIRVVKPNQIQKAYELNQMITDPYGNVVNKINDVTVGKYDIVVVSGSMLPSARWAQLEYYLQLYQLGLIDQEEVLKKTNVVDMDGVLKRASEVNYLRGVMNEMQEEIKKLEGDLQTAERESVHDKKRVELEKFKARLAGLSSKAEAAQMLYKERLSDIEGIERDQMKQEEKMKTMRSKASQTQKR